MQVSVRALVLATMWVAIAAPDSARAQAPASLQSFLRDTIKLTDADFALVEKGTVVTRLFPKTDEGEIAAFGIVKVSVSPDALEKLAVDPRRFRAMEGVEQIGVFSDPPALGDVGALRIPSDDIDALKKCKPGACDVKLTDEALERVAKINWSAPDATQQATQAFKEMMASLATTYRSGGIDALGSVIDKKQPKSRAKEYHRLLENSPYLYKYVPAFNAYVDAYPTGTFEGAVNTLYWMKDTFSPKPVISICASTVARDSGHVLIANRLLGATHFFNAGLDVCVGAPAAGGTVTYIVDVYRARIDPPTGMMAGPAMKRVEKGIEDGVKKSLAGLSSKLKSK